MNEVALIGKARLLNLELFNKETKNENFLTLVTRRLSKNRD